MFTREETVGNRNRDGDGEDDPDPGPGPDQLEEEVEEQEVEEDPPEDQTPAIRSSGCEKDWQGLDLRSSLHPRRPQTPQEAVGVSHRPQVHHAAPVPQDAPAGLHPEAAWGGGEAGTGRTTPGGSAEAEQKAAPAHSRVEAQAPEDQGGSQSRNSTRP